MRFENRVCLVTGGSTGIGAATVRGFVREGAKAAIASDLRVQDMAPMCDELLAKGADARAYQCDIADPGAVANLIECVKHDFGRIDIAVNCAGIVQPDPLFHSDPKTANKVFAVNAMGAYYFVHAVAPVMRDQGKGNIVLVASASGILGTRQLSAYCASKAAVMQMVRGLVPELKNTGIRINCIAPGLTRTAMTAFVATPEGKDYMDDMRYIIPSPYGDPWAEPEDQAEVIMFLASDASRIVHGHCIVTDQGLSTWMPGRAHDPRAVNGTRDL